MTFVKDNKMWLIKDVSVILKSKVVYSIRFRVRATFWDINKQFTLAE